MIAVVAAHVRCRWRSIDRDGQTMASRCFIQINIGAGDSVFVIVFVVFAYKKLIGRTEMQTRDKIGFQSIEQFETSPETIEQELQPRVC